MLLDEIIELAVDNEHPLTVLLRKCLLLAHQLGNEQLKAWANQELSGYKSADRMPEYRIAKVGAHGNFSGPFGSGATNWPIPPVALNEKHRAFAEKVFLFESVSSYEHMMTQSGGGTFMYEWPGDLVVLYQKRFFEGRYVLVNAWQEVPKSAVAELLDAVRNKTLNMALEIQAEIGKGEDLTQISPAEVAEVNRTVTNIIYGGTNIFAADQAQVNTHITQNVIEVGNLAQLEAVLKRSGLSDDDLKKLRQAQESDGEKNIGVRVMDWIKAAAPKVLTSGVTLGADITKEILVSYLKQYNGLG